MGPGDPAHAQRGAATPDRVSAAAVATTPQGSDRARRLAVLIIFIVGMANLGTKAKQADNASTVATTTPTRTAAPSRTPTHHATSAKGVRTEAPVSTQAAAPAPVVTTHAASAPKATPTHSVSPTVAAPAIRRPTRVTAIGPANTAAMPTTACHGKLATAKRSSVRTTTAGAGRRPESQLAD